MRRAGREFSPGRTRPHGAHVGVHSATQSQDHYASLKGFGPGPYEDCKVYENVASARRFGLSPPASAMGRPLVTGAQIGRIAARACTWRSASSPPSINRTMSGKGTRQLRHAGWRFESGARQDARSSSASPIGRSPEYSQHGEGIPFGKGCRPGNDSGGGQPGPS